MFRLAVYTELSWWTCFQRVPLQNIWIINSLQLFVKQYNGREPLESKLVIQVKTDKEINMSPFIAVQVTDTWDFPKIPIHWHQIQFMKKGSVCESFLGADDVSSDQRTQGCYTTRDDSGPVGTILPKINSWLKLHDWMAWSALVKQNSPNELLNDCYALRLDWVWGMRHIFCKCSCLSHFFVTFFRRSASPCEMWSCWACTGGFLLVHAMQIDHLRLFQVLNHTLFASFCSPAIFPSIKQWVAQLTDPVFDGPKLSTELHTLYNTSCFMSHKEGSHSF